MRDNAPEAMGEGKSKRAALLERLREKRTQTAARPQRTDRNTEEAGTVNPAAAQEKAPEPTREQPKSMLPEEAEIVSGPLAELAVKLGLQGQDEKLLPSFFMKDATSPTLEQLRFLAETEKEAAWLCVVLDQAERAKAEEAEMPKAVDMQIYLGVSKDGLEAWGVLLPAVCGGKNLTSEQIAAAFRGRDITYGVQKDALVQAAEQGECLKLFTVAQGVAKQDGTDGEIFDHFPRDKKISFVENATHTVDYKNLHWLQKIQKDDIICDLIQPTEGTDGISVHGAAIRRRSGRMPKIPNGANTRVNKEGTALVADCDGQLAFANNLFRVDQILRVKGDIDNAVGNLDVLGDLDIGGNVADGYALKATGNIIVHGLVEGARLEAGGSIQIMLGMKGNGKGSLEAGDNVASKYLENAHIKAGNSVIADSIINSTVSSGDTVVVVTGRGTIVGGKVTARNKIEAKIVGNDSNRATELVLGADPSLLDAIFRLKKELAKRTMDIEETEKNIRYLEKLESPDRRYQELLAQLKLKLSIDKMMLEKKHKQLLGYEEQLDDSDCQVVATTMYPHTSIEIGGLRMMIQTQSAMCRVYKAEGELKLGSK